MGLVIELGLMAIVAVATLAVGIYNSSSKASTPELNLAEKIEEKRRNRKRCIVCIILGILDY